MIFRKIFVAALLSCTITAAGAQNKEQVIGCWIMAGRAGETMQLNRDGSVLFTDWNQKSSSFETLYGTWKLENGAKSGKRITLYYEDRTKQSFSLANAGKGSWLLTKAGGFRFTKAQPSNCAEATQ